MINFTEDFGAELAQALTHIEEHGGHFLEWKHWNSLVNVLDWEAVWLSLGQTPSAAANVMGVAEQDAKEMLTRSDPPPFRPSRFSPIVLACADVKREYGARFRAVVDWIQAGEVPGDLFQSENIESQMPAVYRIRLKDFAAKCVSVGWEVPAGLRRIAGADTASRVGPWPWGTYETELLRNLRAAAEKFWVGYNPAYPKRAPKHEEVIPYLVSLGVSPTAAEVMAQILRFDGLKPGPRPGGLPEK